MTTTIDIERNVTHRGDLAVIQQVLNRRGTNTGPITDDELVDTLGENWPYLVVMLRTWVDLPEEKKSAYYAAVHKVWNTSKWEKAYRAVVVDVGPGGAAHRALGAVGVGGDYAFVAAALARRSELLVTTAGQGHYDTITGPWRSVIGPIHPDDPAVA